MKRIIVAVCCMLALAVAVQAAEHAKKGEKKKLTTEQKELQKKMIEKYDANKDGKLDKQERGKISAADKKEMEEKGLVAKKREKKNK